VSSVDTLFVWCYSKPEAIRAGGHRPRRLTDAVIDAAVDA